MYFKLNRTLISVAQTFHAYFSYFLSMHILMTNNSVIDIFLAKVDVMFTSGKLCIQTISTLLIYSM